MRARYWYNGIVWGGRELRDCLGLGIADWAEWVQAYNSGFAHENSRQPRGKETLLPSREEVAEAVASGDIQIAPAQREIEQMPDDGANTRECRVCGVEKPPTQYYGTDFGGAHTCKKCMYEIRSGRRGGTFYRLTDPVSGQVLAERSLVYAARRLGRSRTAVSTAANRGGRCRGWYVERIDVGENV